MTPIELAATDHIKELIIVHSTPNYVPKQVDLVQSLAVEGQQMKIDPEPLIAYDQTKPKKTGAPRINKKPQRDTNEDSKVGENGATQSFEGSFNVRDQALGPAKAWDKV